jgi:hypothetical protein
VIKISEGNLIISVPEDRYFRFEDSPTYDAIKANGLTEADVAWMVEGEDTLWLMELKDYGPQSPGQLSQAQQKLRTRLPKNIAHAVLMMSAVWAGTPFGIRLQQDIEQTFPDFPSEAQPIRAGAVINVEQTDIPLLGPLNDALRSALDAFELDVVFVLPASSDRVETDLGIQIEEVRTQS